MTLLVLFNQPSGGGIDATATPAGVSATGAVTAPTGAGAANVATTGVSATGSVTNPAATGGTTVNGTATPAGVGATATLGALLAKGDGWGLPAGVSSTGAVSTPAPSGSATVTVSGVGATASVGTPVAGTASGASITASEVLMLYQIYKLHGLDTTPLVVDASSRSSGDLVQSVSGTANVTVSTVSAPSTTAVDAGTMIRELAALHGISTPLFVSATSRSAGVINQSINSAGGTTTITRV